MKSAPLRVGAVQYAFSLIKTWADFEEKISHIVSDAGEKGVKLLVFPEYLGLELTLLTKNKKDLALLPELALPFQQLFDRLSRQWNMVIQSGTTVVHNGAGRYFNRAFLFTPEGHLHFQDKIQLVPSEKESNCLVAGQEIQIFDVPCGKIAIAICYDAEFPHLIKQAVKQGVSLILVPSCTESLAGYYRVALSCRARALENQCFVVHSCTVKASPWIEWLQQNVGKAGIFGPCDGAFPPSGVLAQGRLARSETIIADLDFDKLKEVREKGSVRNFQDYTLS